MRSRDSAPSSLPATWGITAERRLPLLKGGKPHYARLRQMMSDETIGFRERLSYGLGDMACAMVAFSYLSFLMYFYTDIAYLPVAVVGTMMFIVRAWDAVWDIMMGNIVDRTHTRSGRARPYVLW